MCTPRSAGCREGRVFWALWSALLGLLAAGPRSLTNGDRGALGAYA